MQAPRALARFNKVVTNRVQGVYAPYLPPWAMVTHVGRRSGRDYRTPILAFRSGTTLAAVMFYGTEADWVRNALAAGSVTVTRAGRERRWSDLRLVEPGEPGLPVAAKVLGRVPGAVLVGTLA